MIQRPREFGWWHEVVLLLLLMAVVIGAGMFVPKFFWSLTQQLRLSRQMWEVALLSLGMTLIILTGGIDLSVGSIMALSAVSFGIVFEASESLPMSAVSCLLVALCCGALNGALVVWLKLHPLIVTLATFAAFRGIAEGVSQGAHYSGFGEAFRGLSHDNYLGISIAGWSFFGLVAVLTVMLTNTSWGRYLYAIGHNESAVRFSGIPVDGMKFSLYSANGVLSGLAAIVLVSRTGAANADVGSGFELEVITAVVIGGTSIFGGRGTVIGTALGVLLIHQTRKFVDLYLQAAEWTPILIGCLLIGSILVYRACSRDSK